LTLDETTTRRSARKAKGDGHLRRAEILEAAERIFVAEGYEGATIRKIADEVGVSSTALYMHFPDKGRILLEICEGTIQQLLGRNAEIAAKPLDAPARVRMMLEAYMLWGLEHPNAYHLVYSSPTSEALWSDGMADLCRRSYEVFRSVMREVAASGRLRAGSPTSASQSMWMACHGVVALLTARPTFGWAANEELIQVTLDGLMSGLLTD
jgi:AcrR family transcriptional regulator